MKYNMMPGKKRWKRKPLMELYVNGKFTEDRKECNQELQRHCEEVYMDPEETKEVPEGRIQFFKRKGDQQFTKDGRSLAVPCRNVAKQGQRTRRCRCKRDDQAELLQEQIFFITKCFQKRFMGQMEAPSSRKIVILVFLPENPDAEPKKGIRGYRVMALTSVMSK